MKQQMCSELVLRSSDFIKRFLLQTDASERSVGAVLSQANSNGEEHPIGYFSHKLLTREEHFS